jgi:hypothetical protein
MRLCAWGEQSLARSGVAFSRVEIARGEGGRLVDGEGGESGNVGGEGREG